MKDHAEEREEKGGHGDKHPPKPPHPGPVDPPKPPHPRPVG